MRAERSGDSAGCVCLKLLYPGLCLGLLTLRSAGAATSTSAKRGGRAQEEAVKGRSMKMEATQLSNEVLSACLGALIMFVEARAKACCP